MTPNGHFQIKLVEMYYGTPIVEVCCNEPTLLTPDTDRELASTILDQPYPKLAALLDYRNISHAVDYGPEEEATVHRSEPFIELSDRLVALVRFQAASMTSLVHSMRVNMLLRHAMNTNFAPDFDSAVRIARRAVDTSRIPTT